MATVNYMWQTVIMPRQGDVYVFGGSLSPNAVQQGTDCSGAVSEVNEALQFGPVMNWLRQFWTGTFAGAVPGQRGPFGGVAVTADWVCIADPRHPPAGAVMTVAVLQDPDPASAHMVCAVLDPDNVTGFGGPGVYVGIESGGQFTDANGNSTLHIGPLATGVDNPEFNQYFALTDTISDLPDPGGPPAPPLTAEQVNALTVIAACAAVGLNVLGQQMALCCALDESRMRMLANPAVPESMALPHEGVGTDADSCGPFQQRPSQGWGTVACEMDWSCSASLFANALAKTNYNDPSHTPGWRIQQVQRSGDPTGSNYDAQWNTAVALYNSVINAGDDMSAAAEKQVAEIWGALFNPVQSQSPFRALGEGPVWATKDFPHNDDGFVHPQYVEWAVQRGDAVNLAKLQALAAGDITLYPDRIEDIRLAQQVLARVQAGPVPAPTPGPAPAPVPVPAPVPTPAAPVNPPGTISTTQLMQWAKDALTILGTIGTWATAAHNLLGQYLPGSAGVIVPATLAIATTGVASHTVRSNRVAQKQLVTLKGKP